MEQKSESEKSKNIEKNNFDSNNISLINPNISFSHNTKKKEGKSSNQKEIDKETFQIIQQKGTLNIKNNDSSSLTENLNDESSQNLDNNNNIKYKEINTKDLDELNKEFTKMKLSSQKSEGNYFNEGNKNTYTLLNTYYKDIDLTFKNDNMNKGKNFLHKDNFKEFINYNKYNNLNNNDISNINNSPNFSYYHPYNTYQNQILNNQMFFPYNTINNQGFQYFYPENAFTINNQTNYYFTNYINNYNYNFNVNKNRYNRKKENIEPKFFTINIDNILKGIDTRTTVMIRHIPNKYSYHNLLEEINTICKDKYDFFYLPLDSENNCNLGYAFINFINSLHIVYFYNIFKSRKWLQFNSFKECDLTFAKYQGKYELTSNIEKNMGKNEDKKRLPIIFEIKNPPKIDLFKKYYDIIKEYKPEMVNDINWI
jgi:hypothetical protein